MESCSDSDSNDDGLEIGRRRHGHGDEDIVINTELASKEVDAERGMVKLKLSQVWMRA